MNKFAAILLAAGTAIFLSACATKGPLTLPPGPAPEPLFGNPKPATPASKTDVSTDTKARPQ